MFLVSMMAFCGDILNARITILFFRVWLFAVKEELDSIPSSSGPRYFHAFDISASQFPGSASLPFSIQNIVDPFPPEHHCRYDLVHVRLLIAALGADQYARAVANLSQLLSKDPNFCYTLPLLLTDDLTAPTN